MVLSYTILILHLAANDNEFSYLFLQLACSFLCNFEGYDYTIIHKGSTTVLM